MGRVINRLCSILVICFSFLLISCSQESIEQNQVFVTEYGTGPDKWVTAWLLSRYLYPDSVIKIVEPDQALPKGVAFDMPSAKIYRNASQSSFETALELYQVEGETMRRLASAIHDPDRYYWKNWIWTWSS